MIRAGRLDRRITLQEVQTVPDGYGFTTAWVDTSSLWAERTDQGGEEFMAVGMQLNRARAVFRIRWREGVDATMRVRSDETSFAIVAINEIGRREGLELMCEAVS